MSVDSPASAARTWIFVPADKPAMFETAAKSAADMVILDLEDAVAPDRKEYARTQAFEWLSSTTTPTALRINACESPWHEADVNELTKLGGQIVMLPKAEAPQDVAEVIARSSSSALVALIETAKGMANAASLATVGGVTRLAFGNFDLGAELGIDSDDASALSLARQMIVLASAAAGLPGPIDGVTGAISDQDRVEHDTRASARLGFTGKLCIHPDQVAAANAALLPSDEEIAWAHRVLEARDPRTDGVLSVDGRMVDAPVIKRAQRLLARSTPERPDQWRIG